MGLQEVRACTLRPHSELDGSGYTSGGFVAGATEGTGTRRRRIGASCFPGAASPMSCSLLFAQQPDRTPSLSSRRSHPCRLPHLLCPSCTTSTTTIETSYLSSNRPALLVTLECPRLATRLPAQPIAHFLIYIFARPDAGSPSPPHSLFQGSSLPGRRPSVNHISIKPGIAISSPTETKSIRLG